MLFKDVCYLELWQPLCSVEHNHLCNFGRGYYEDQFCEIILNLGQWFRRCYLKDFLSGALAAFLFSGVEPFVQFWKRAPWGTFMWSYMKFGPVLQEGMSFKERVYWRTDEGQRRITIPHLALCPRARHINPSLVLVQPRKTHPYITGGWLMGRKESNQTNKTSTHNICYCREKYALLQSLNSLHAEKCCTLFCHLLIFFQNGISFKNNLGCRDFPTFLKSVPGACWIWGKKHLDHQIGKTRTELLF